VGAEERSRHTWTLAVAVVAAVAVAPLVAVLWRSPLPLSETVALLEDVARRTAGSFFIPDTPYYRPLFHATLGAIWNSGGSLETRLAAIHVLQIVPLLALVGALVAWLRPRRAAEAGAALVAVAVLLGSPGMRDNLELPLSYTTVGMPLAVVVWALLTVERRKPWHLPLVLILMLVAIGFKEQGLAIVAVVAAAVVTRAPAASRGLAVAVGVLAIGYVALRLSWHARLPIFEQSVGLGFHEIEPREAIARYGAFPYPVYAYSALATVGNVLFSEPTRGVFSLTWTIGHGVAQAWEYVHLLSSAALTALIAWWGLRTVTRARVDGWATESRTAVALVLVLLACGALSFNYSRDRLGGMAVPFYAAAAYFAVLEAARSARGLPVARQRWITAGLIALGVLWGVRTVGSVEAIRAFSARNQLEWMTQGPPRRLEFAERHTYLAIMNELRPQGTAAGVPHAARYPGVLASLFGPTPDLPAPPRATLTEAIERHDVARAFAIVHAGQDPNRLIVVRNGALTGGRDRLVSPLWWAVAVRDRNAVLMLLDAGARVERSDARAADCLADTLGETAIAELLRRYGNPPPGECGVSGGAMRPTPPASRPGAS
jgi:hypothetical protein